MAWASKLRQEKVALLYPLRESASGPWSIALALVTQHTPVATGLLFDSHYELDYARNDLVEKALEKGCTKVLFLDVGNIPKLYREVDGKPTLTFFPELVGALLSHDYPIVSGLYCRKLGGWNAYMLDSEGTKLETLKGPLEQVAGKHLYVDAVGMGCCMVDARVFDRVEYPWFSFRRKGGRGEVKQEMSEDIWFCRRANQAGFRVLVDSNIVCTHEMTAYRDSDELVSIQPGMG